AADSRIHIVKLKNYLERFGNEVPAVFDQTTLFQKDQSNGFSRDRLFSPYDSKVLHSLCFDVDLIGRNAEDLCQSRLHFGEIRQQFRTLRKDIRIDVADLVAFFSNEVGGVAKKFQTRDSFISIVRVGKHFTDIAEATCSEQCIRYRVA